MIVPAKIIVFISEQDLIQIANQFRFLIKILSNLSEIQSKGKQCVYGNKSLSQQSQNQYQIYFYQQMAQGKDSKQMASEKQTVRLKGLLSSEIKGEQGNARISKLLLRGEEVTLRHVKSGSVKNKLNLENTKLKMNIDNLSANLNIREQNQVILKGELEKYREKIKKYKDRLRQKENIIAKLISKIESRASVSIQFYDGGQKARLHLERANEHRSALDSGLHVNPVTILQNYEELAKHFQEQSKKMSFLEKQNLIYQKQIDELKFKLNNFGDPSKILSIQPQTLGAIESFPKKQKQKLQFLLAKEKSFRNLIIQQIRASSISIQPQYLEQAQQLESLHLATPQMVKEYDQQGIASLLQQKIRNSKLHEQIDSNKQIMHQTEERLKKLLERLSKIEEMADSMSKSKELMETVLKHSEQDKKQMQILEQNAEKAKQQFQKLAELRKQDLEEWGGVQRLLNDQIDQLLKKIASLEEKIDLEKRKKRKFELSLLTYDPLRQQILGPRTEPTQQYLDEKIELLKDQSKKHALLNKQLQEQLLCKKEEFNILTETYAELQNQLLLTQDRLKNLGEEVEIYQDLSENTELDAAKMQSQYSVDWSSPQHSQVLVKIKQKIERFSTEKLKKQFEEIAKSEYNLKKANENLRAENIAHIVNQEKLKNKLHTLQKELESLTSLRAPHKIVDNESIQFIEEKNALAINEAERILDEKQNPNREDYQNLLNQYKQLSQAYLNLLNDLVNKESYISEQEKSGREKEGKYSGEGVDRQEHDESHEMIEDSFKNINDQLERLIKRNQQKDLQIEKIKGEHEEEKKRLEQQIEGKRSQIKIMEKINSNLTGLVVHLEGELNKMRGDASLSSSQIKNEDSIQNKLEQLKILAHRQEQLMQEEPATEEEEQERLKNLEQIEEKIKQINLGLKSNISQEPEKSFSKIKDCANCLNMIRTNAELIGKLRKFEAQKQQRQKMLEGITESLKEQDLESQLSPEQMKNKLYEVREKFLQHEGEIALVTKNAEQQYKKLQDATEKMQELMIQVEKKENENLRLGAEVLRKYRNQVATEEEKERLDTILEDFDKKLEQMQIKLSSKKMIEEPSRQDLFDTINYLNEQNQLLKIQNTKFHEKFDKEEGYLPIDPQEKLKANQLIQQNAKLSNRLKELDQKYSEYFKLIQDGKGAQIVRMKDEMIEELSTNLIEVQAQNAKLAQENKKLRNEISSIEIQIKQIEGAVAAITTNPYQKHEQQSLEGIEKSSTSKIGDTIASLGGMAKDLSSKCKMYELELSRVRETSPFAHKEESQIIFPSTLIEKLKQLSSIIENHNKKEQPFSELPITFQELPELNQVLIQFVEYLKIIWVMIEDRTKEYNHLRDQLNLISMECINVNVGGHSQQDQSGNLKQIDVIEERYEQVLAELLEYESLNKRLQLEVARLKEEVRKYKLELQEIHSRFMTEIKSESSSECPYNEDVLKKIIQSSDSKKEANYSFSKEYPEVIKLLLLRIQELQNKLQVLYDELQQKNKKFDSIIQRELSFQSSRSERMRDTEKSSASDKDSERRKKDENMIQASLEKSISALNSEQIFKEIEELAKANDEIREKNIKKNTELSTICNKIQNMLQTIDNEQLKAQLQLQVDQLKTLLENDVTELLSSKRLDIKHAEQIHMTSAFESSRYGTQKRLADRNILENRQFIQENEDQVTELLIKLAEIMKDKTDLNLIRELLIKKISKQDLKQVILQKKERQERIEKIANILQASQGSILRNEQDWVEGEDIEQIINRIYPQKSELSQIVSDGLESILSAESGNSILKAIEQIFLALSRKEKEITVQLQRKEDQMAEYARNMTKILMAKSSESAGSLHQLGQQFPFKKTSEIKSEYQIKKQEEERAQQQKSEQHIQ